MKFCTLAVAAFTLLVPEVNSQTVTNGNFQFVESYNFKYGLGREYLGGGSIVGNTLYLVVRAEKADSYIASVPVERDGKLLPHLVLVCV